MPGDQFGRERRKRVLAELFLPPAEDDPLALVIVASPDFS
jgi:hypothetical protein